jgi:hypothetical protein
VSNTKKKSAYNLYSFYHQALLYALSDFNHAQVTRGSLRFYFLKLGRDWEEGAD